MGFNLNRLIGIALISTGLILTLYYLVKLYVGELREVRKSSRQSHIETREIKLNSRPRSRFKFASPFSHIINSNSSDNPLFPGLNRRGWLIAAVAILIMAGLLLRLHGLETQSMSHPEIYVPGIELPEGISEPPPRLALHRVIWWHIFNEPHPQAYYYLMWIWTTLFGTGLGALRLPSVIFGTLSLLLVFYVASHVYDLKTGILGMALLAFNGHHLYWSQRARMYAMLGFAGLFSTLLLLKLISAMRRRPVLEALYVAISFLGVWTEIYFWPFLAAQILWVVSCMREGGSKVFRVISLQALVVILGAPLWAHAIYNARNSPLERPTLIFLMEYLSFGFLFERDSFSLPPRLLPQALILSLALFAVILIAKTLRGGVRFTFRDYEQEPLTTRRLVPIAAGVVVMIIGMSMLGSRRQYLMMLAGLIPVLVLPVPSALRLIASSPGSRSLTRLSLPSGHWLMFFLAFVPALLTFTLSIIFPMLASRLFLLFTPFLLILIASGVTRYARKLIVGIPLCLILVVLHISSISYFKQTPSDSRDYQELAHKLRAAADDGDLIFVHDGSWRTTPIFYYLHNGEYRFIAEGFQNAVQRNPSSRVWLLLFDNQEPTEQMRTALSDFRIKQAISARGGQGLLLVRRADSIGLRSHALQ